MSAATEAAPLRQRRRRAGGWVAIGAVLAVVAVAGSVLAGIGRWSERDVLDPASAGPAGTRAIAEILREQGIDVIVARDRAAVARALADGDATLALPDAPYLSDDALEVVAAAAGDVVLLDPRSRSLRVLLPGATPEGVAGPDALEPACDLPDATRAGPLTPGAMYRPGPDHVACYPAGEGYGLVSAGADARRVVAVDARALFTNEHLATAGNAALAANLLGRHPILVWYVPSPEDSDLADADPSLGELTPPWVSPVVVLLLIAGLAAAVWRGRRFGPLVAERLPVTVRAGETTEGRARLYAHARDVLHAADELRIGALGRLGRVLGLGPAATAEQIADAAAARAALPRGDVRGILLHDLPRTDADLVDLDVRLRALEEAVHAAVRPGRNSR